MTRALLVIRTRTTQAFRLTGGNRGAPCSRHPTWLSAKKITFQPAGSTFLSLPSSPPPLPPSPLSQNPVHIARMTEIILWGGCSYSSVEPRGLTRSCGLHYTGGWEALVGGMCKNWPCGPLWVYVCFCGLFTVCVLLLITEVAEMCRWMGGLEGVEGCHGVWGRWLHMQLAAGQVCVLKTPVCTFK